MTNYDLLKKVRANANTGLFRDGYRVFMVESPHDKKCYTGALTKGLHVHLAEEKIYFYSPVDVHSFYRSIGGLSQQEINKFEDQEVGRKAVEHFADDTKNCSGAYAIVDRDLLGDDGRRNDPPSFKLTDSCDIDTEILCCLPRLLERVVMDKTGREQSYDDSGERVFYANAVCSAYRLGKLLNCETCVSEEFKASGEREIIEDFFAASKRANRQLPSFLSDQKILSFSKWCSVSACFAQDVDESTLKEIKTSIRRALAGDSFLQETDGGRSLADENFDTAVGKSTFEERNKVWRFCNGHDLVIFLGENFGKNFSPLGHQETEEQIVDAFLGSNQAMKIFWKTPLGKWIKAGIAKSS